MGICGRLLSLYRREEPVVDKRGKAILANGELHIIKFSPHLRVRVSAVSFILSLFDTYVGYYALVLCVKFEPEFTDVAMNILLHIWLYFLSSTKCVV